MDKYTGILGIIVMLGLAYLLSTSRKDIRWRTVIWGLVLQFLFALMILKTDLGRAIFKWLNDFIVAILDSAQSGASFVFGRLADTSIPIAEKTAEGGFAEVSNQIANVGFVFGFKVLPTIVFFASFMAVLYHLGVMSKVIKVISGVMERTMKTSGAESLSAASNIFVGQTEAPLVVKPFIDTMTKSELMAIMTAGFATVAGSVLAAFVGFLVTGIPDIAGHLLAASIMSAPAALVMAKLFVPETDTPHTAEADNVSVDNPDKNIIDAAARGASEGMRLAINIAAMLIAFLGLIALVNTALGYLGSTEWLNIEELSLSYIFGKVFAPFAFLLGVEWKDCGHIGELIGNKLMINEFVAYLSLKDMIAAGELSERSMIIASYALCGFANLSSIGIQLGGLGAIAPSRRHDLAQLALKAMFAGAFASFITACIAGILL